MREQAETVEKPQAEDPDYVRLTAEVVKALLSNSGNHVSVDRVPDVIREVHSALVGLGRKPEAAAEVQKPYVPIKNSVHRDYIVCLEDGKKLRTMRRYLASRYGMTPDEYRRKWGLPSDYPMTAPSYRERRSELAKQSGLGRKTDPVEEPVAKPTKAGRSGTRKSAGTTRQPRTKR